MFTHISIHCIKSATTQGVCFGIGTCGTQKNRNRLYYPIQTQLKCQTHEQLVDEIIELIIKRYHRLKFSFFFKSFEKCLCLTGAEMNMKCIHVFKFKHASKHVFIFYTSRAMHFFYFCSICFF